MRMFCVIVRTFYAEPTQIIRKIAQVLRIDLKINVDVCAYKWYYNGVERTKKGFKFMRMNDVVLINDIGCEIARETITAERTEEMIIDSWVIYPGDTIQIVETWHEI